VGQYTTGAVLSIAFGQDMVAIDGNVVRVLCRLFDYGHDPTTAAGRKDMRHYAEALLPYGQAGDLNQAMMELGATVCLPRAPHCTECPVGQFCRARSLGVQETRPVTKRQGEMPHRELVAALIEDEGKILIVRRLPKGLLGGLWELPGGEVLTDEGHPQALERVLCANLGLDVTVGAEIAVVRHAYTHFRVTVHLYHCEMRGTPTPSGPWDGFRWLAPGKRGAYGLTGVTVKALAHVRFSSPESPAES
jgi:A/G-specific adenine glycosylase